MKLYLWFLAGTMIGFPIAFFIEPKLDVLPAVIELIFANGIVLILCLIITKGRK